MTSSPTFHAARKADIIGIPISHMAISRRLTSWQKSDSMITLETIF